MSKNRYALGLDVSTKTIGISLFEIQGNNLKLILLHHVTPVVKPRPVSKMQELFEKSKIFEDEFLLKYKDFGVETVIIEEPLLRSNNVNTVATLLRFNGIISRAVYDILGIVPEYISSYDARAFAFPELMQKRTINKKGEVYSQKESEKLKPVLFGAYDYEVDKKMVIFDKVCELEPQITWLFDKKGKLKKESLDMSDAYVCVLGWKNKNGL